MNDQPFEFEANVFPVGRWIINKSTTGIYLYEKPNWFHILMAKWLLGWEWRPFKNLNKKETGA